eukprot:gene6587-3240_t
MSQSSELNRPKIKLKIKKGIKSEDDFQASGSQARPQREKKSTLNEDYVDLSGWEDGGGGAGGQKKGKQPGQAFGAEEDMNDPDELYDYDDEYDDGGPRPIKARKLAKGTETEGDGGELVEVNRNFSYLDLKPDHTNRPLWVTPDGRIFLETFSNIYKQAYDFLSAIVEPVCRPQVVHEYQLTPHSLYAAAYDFLIAIAEPVCRPQAVHEYQLTPHSLYAAVSVGLDTETIINVLNRLSKVLKRNKFYVENDLIVSKALKEQAAAQLRARVEISTEQATVS